MGFIRIAKKDAAFETPPSRTIEDKEVESQQQT